MGKKINIGSAECFRTAWNGTVPELSTICVEANRFTHIKNGATVDYNQEKVIETDDLEMVSKTALKSENVKVKFGVMTFDGDTMKYLVATAREGTTTETGKTLTKLGGVSNDDETSYLWCLHHIDKKDGDIWVVFVGKQNAGVTIEFKPDSATVINAEVDAEPLDDDGTKLLYFEEVKETQGSGD